MNEDSPDSPKYYVILREPPKKMTSKAYMKYSSEVNARRRRSNSMYYYIERLLNRLPKCKRRKTDALHIAESISKKINIKIDRNAKRNYDSLICWYCENWPLVSQHIFSTYYELFEMPEIQNQKQPLGPQPKLNITIKTTAVDPCSIEFFLN